jgi:hypothetical protein
MSNAQRWFDKSDFIEPLDLRSELTTNDSHSPLVLSLSKGMHRSSWP